MLEEETEEWLRLFFRRREPLKASMDAKMSSSPPFIPSTKASMVVVSITEGEMTTRTGCITRSLRCCGLSVVWCEVGVVVKEDGARDEKDDWR